jgi:hypothetical protein
MSVIARLTKLEAALDDLTDAGGDRTIVEHWGVDPDTGIHTRAGDGVIATHDGLLTMPRPPHRELLLRLYVGIVPPTIEG